MVVASFSHRRFPSRVELLDSVVADNLQAHVAVAEQALAVDDPWDGFAFYLEETCRLRAADRGLNDAMGMRFPRAAAVEAARRRLYDLSGQLIARAQQSGQLRADRAHPLPQPPLSPRQVYRAMLTLGRRSTGTTGQHRS
jgi:hypothetical protein